MKNQLSVYTKSIVLNYLYSLFSQYGVIIIGLFSRVIILKKLGIKYIGITAFFVSVVSAISFINLGIGKAVGYVMLPFVAKEDNESLKKLYNYTKKIILLLAGLIFIVGILLIPFLNFFIKENDRIENLYLCYFIYLVSNVVTYLCGADGVIFFAHHKMRVNEVAVFWSSFFTKIFQIFFLFLYPRYEVFLLITVFGNLYYVLYIHLSFCKQFPDYIGYKGNINIETKKKIFTRVKDMFFIRLSNTAIDTTDKILLTRFAGVNNLGIYDNYSIIFSTIQSSVKRIYNSMESVIGIKSSVSSDKDSYALFKRLLFFFSTIGIILITDAFCLSQDFMQLYVGTEYLLGDILLVIVFYNIFADILVYPFSGFYNTGNYYKYVKYNSFISAIVNIIISIILVFRYGMLGIFFATFISRFFILLPGSIFLVTRMSLNVRMLTVIKSVVIDIFQFSIILLVGNLIFKRIVVLSYFMLFFKAFIITLYSLFCIFILNCKNSEMCYLFNKLRKKHI